MHPNPHGAVRTIRDRPPDSGKNGGPDGLFGTARSPESHEFPKWRIPVPCFPSQRNYKGILIKYLEDSAVGHTACTAVEAIRGWKTAPQGSTGRAFRAESALGRPSRNH